MFRPSEADLGKTHIEAEGQDLPAQVNPVLENTLLVLVHNWLTVASVLPSADPVLSGIHWGKTDAFPTRFPFSAGERFRILFLFALMLGVLVQSILVRTTTKKAFSFLRRLIYVPCCSERPSNCH